VYSLLKGLVSIFQETESTSKTLGESANFYLQISNVASDVVDFSGEMGMILYLSKYGDTNIDVYRSLLKDNKNVSDLKDLSEELKLKEQYKYSVYERFGGDVVLQIEQGNQP